MRKLFRFLKKVWRKLLGKPTAANDPFAELETKGLKIAESTKATMHSPWGIDRMFPWLIEIGESCIISTNVVILAHDASTAFSIGYTKIGRVTIGNHVFIGHNSTVLCGVTIGDNVIVGANSLVNKDLKPNGVYAGNPAKYICSFEEYRDKRRKEFERSPCSEKNWIYWSREASTDEKNRLLEQMGSSGVAYMKSNTHAFDVESDTL